MLASIRKFAKTPFALIIFAPLVLGFAVFGINGDILGGSGSSFVVKAGSRTVSGFDFKREFDGYKEQLEQRYQQQITPELAQEQGLDRRVVEELAFRESLDGLLARIGLRASDKMLTDELRKAPVFFDPVTGEFDEARYAEQLRSKGLTPTVFEGILTDEMARNQFMAAAMSGTQTPGAYAALGGLFALEQRDLAWFTVDSRVAGVAPAPTDAEVQAFIKENAAQLMLPEFRGFTVVRFSAKDYLDRVTVNPADVQKQFDFQKDSLSRAELRTVVQIPAKDAAQAAAIIARIKAGEAPAAVAKAIGATAVLFNDKPRSAFFDPAVAAAAFALPEGGVSAPIKGQFGLAVLAVTQVSPGETATLEDHRAAIEAKVRGDLAGAKISDLSKIYEDAHEAGATLPEAARKAGAPLTVYAPVTSDGRDQNGQPVQGLAPEIVKAVFELIQDGESDIQEAGPGEYFAVRVDRIVAPAMPPLETVKPQLIRTMMLRREAERMQAKADQLVARISKGETLEAVAASVGAKVVRVSGLSRATVSAHQALGRDLVGGALAAKKGEPFAARAASFGINVAEVTAVRAGNPAEVALATRQGGPQYREQIFGDTIEAARVYARTKMKTETSLERARLALGIDPATASQGLGKAAGKGK